MTVVRPRLRAQRAQGETEIGEDFQHTYNTISWTKRWQTGSWNLLQALQAEDMAAIRAAVNS
jgi:hypothetical protein